MSSNSAAAAAAGNPTMEHLSMSLKTCSRAWITIYVVCSLIFGLLTSVMFHVIMIGGLMILLSYYRLPTVNPAIAFKILGADPRNYDGSPSKRNDLGLIAHRAAGLDGPPENTVEALVNSKTNGAKCVEFDVSFSSDGVAVVFHDDTVDRMATNGSGSINKMTWKEIQKLQVKNKIFSSDLLEGSPDKKAVYKIPKVTDFVSECLKLNMKMIIDLKSYDRPDLCVNLINELYAQHPSLYEHALVSSFFPNIIYSIRSGDPKIVCSMAWRPHFIAYESYTGSLADFRPRFESVFTHHCAILADILLTWAFHDFLWYFLGLSAVLIHKGVLTQEYVQRWRERGVRVVAWTVNDSLERAYLSKCLHVTSMSDSLDSVSVDKILENNEEIINTS